MRTPAKRGCLNCRARRRKCDEVRPACARCRLRNDTCKWDEPFAFRSTGIDDRHPSMLQSPFRREKRGEQSDIQIIDVSFEDRKKLRKTRKLGLSADAVTSVAVRDEQCNSGELLVASPPPLDPSNVVSTPENQSPSSNRDVDQFEKLDLGTLDYLTSHVSNIEILASAGLSARLPGTGHTTLTADCRLGIEPSNTSSVYHPNAHGRELRSTLHLRMLETARKTAFNKQPSSELVADHHTVSRSLATPTATDSVNGRSTQSSLASQTACGFITPQRQLLLWRNYLDEIAPWLDMLDHDRHFQTTIPTMARSTPHLHYSILALSARQIERRSMDTCHVESLDLYQRAIQLIVHRLEHLETEVITSCVLLCVLEMMSSSSRAWAGHLDGCAMLLEAARINGVVGGVRQALFWCFARMDLWGGYLGDTFTKIPTNRWFIPSDSMASAVSQFKCGSSSEAYANYAVFLCASAINVISTQATSRPSTGDVQSRESQFEPSPALYSTRWKALYQLLEDWHRDRPHEILALMYENFATNHSEGQSDHPFPIILYTTSPGTSGNQMYHAAMLLLLQHKPGNIHLPIADKSSIDWHARQICGIALTNEDHSAWTNALQPLWMAGKVMSRPSEHKAVLELLYRIERETGFATAWRADDLKEFWGFESGGVCK